MADDHSKSSFLKSVRIFDADIGLGDQQELGARLTAELDKGPKSVFFCNVHMLMLAQDDRELAALMAATDLLLPDGVPIAWLQRRLGNRRADVLRGYEAVNLICTRAAASGKPVGFLGSTDKVLEVLSAKLRQCHPGLEISFVHSPPLIGGSIEFDPALAGLINSYDLYCLFIGLGCPKQEKWIGVYAPDLNCSLLAVGAAFDWLAGTTPMPPRWMEKSGLGWLFRLLQNPRKMWHRYSLYNTQFIARSIKLLTWDRLIHRQTGKMPE